ncbi:hypothetical protein STHAL_32175 [Streptomyces halstedii]|uniref:Peptidase MA-like domain-containing protein n=1 Tax=Streptomyces halstedii TaxID=1944 RepID=A0ABS6U0N6_STRHA|nr:hypothetical protein [Streptomyces halstedii]MBV7674105.1 hypothetical protein [Streptomyces halstedii]
MRWYPNADDQTVLTRHPSPVARETTTTRNLMQFTTQQHQRSAAIHEAAHTVLFLEAGAPVRSVLIRVLRSDADTSGDPLGTTDIGHYSDRLEPFLTALAGGERAEDRWMRETGLWNPVRAWASERHALHDRDYARQLVRKYLKHDMTCGITDQGWTDYLALHTAADRALDRVWETVLTLADALLERHHLTGEEAARIAGSIR